MPFGYPTHTAGSPLIHREYGFPKAVSNVTFEAAYFKNDKAL